MMPNTQAEEVIEEQELPDLDLMSDEELMSMPDPTIQGEFTNAPDESTDTVEGNDEDAGEGQGEGNENAEDDEGEEEEGEETTTAESEESDSDEGDTEQERTEEIDGTEEGTSEGDVSPTPETQLAELFTPFKANGKQMQISSIEDARVLMQMGANYNKKMAGMKDSRKLLKMLQNNDLLDAEKISRLIDLDKKDPDAIRQLIKDSGLDVADIDTEEKIEYKPNTYNVTDNEVDLDGVLDEIQDTPTFNETIDTISNKWDDSSKQIALDDPTIIKTINDHIGNGIYSQIMGIVDTERALNRLPNMSDLQAYKHVGDVLDAQGAFNKQPPVINQRPPETVIKPVDKKLANRKRAASSVKSMPKSKANTNYNPLDLSDEEFNKAAAPI